MIPRETTTRTAFCARCTPFWTLWERFWPFLEKIFFSKNLKNLTFPRTPPLDLPNFTTEIPKEKIENWKNFRPQKLIFFLGRKTTRTAFCARCTPFWTLWERFWPFLGNFFFSKILKILTFPRTPPFDLPDFTPWFHLWFLQNRKFFKNFSEIFSKHFFSMKKLRPRGSLWGALHVEAIKSGGHRIRTSRA